MTYSACICMVAIFSRTATVSASKFGMVLNGRDGEALLERSSLLQATCWMDSNSGAAVQFLWTIGLGTCANSTSQPDDAGLSALRNSTVLNAPTGNASTLQASLQDLLVARYHFIKCIITTVGLSKLAICRQFRTYGRLPAESALYLDNESQPYVNLHCGMTAVPSNVPVNVTWSLGGATVQRGTSPGLAAAYSNGEVYAFTSYLILENTPSSGGQYTCTLASSQYGVLTTQTVDVFKMALAVMGSIVEKSVAADSKTAVAVTCTAYGYPLPSLKLSKRDFVYAGNQTQRLVKGGVSTVYQFTLLHPDDSAEILLYACVAENSLGSSMAYLSRSEKETSQCNVTLAQVLVIICGLLSFALLR